MRRCAVFVHEMAHPEDCSGLASDLSAGRLRAADIRAVFVKTEGNGLDNDWSRPLALRALAAHVPASSAHAGAPMVVVSGGCEGMLTPHMTVLACVDEPHGAAGPDAALALGTAVSQPLRGEQIGREAHLQRAAEVVAQACRDAGLAPEEVVHVHVLSPWLSRELAVAAPGDAPLVAATAHASKPAIRAAAALGAGVALGDIGIESVRWTGGGPVAGGHTRRVAVTAGDTGGRLQALVLGHSLAWRGTLRVASAQMSSMLDLQALESVCPRPPVAAFFKGDPPPDGRVRGARTTMGADSDIHAFRHFRAAMSGVFGAVLGSPRVFIGGGAECQCVPGGGLVTTLYEARGGPP